MTDTLSHINNVIDALSSMGITIDKSESYTQQIYDKMTEMKTECDKTKCKAWVWSGKNGIIPHCCSNNSIDGNDFCKKHGAAYGECKFCGNNHEFHWQLLGRYDRSSWRDHEGCPELKRRCYGTKKVTTKKKNNKKSQDEQHTEVEKKVVQHTKEKTEVVQHTEAKTEVVQHTEEKQKDDVKLENISINLNNVDQNDKKEKKKQSKKSKKTNNIEEDETVQFSELESALQDFINPETKNDDLLEGDNNRLSEKNRIIEKGRKYLSDKNKKKQDLKQKTEEARKGKKEKKKENKVNTENHQVIDIDGTKIYVDTSDEIEEDKFTAYEYIREGYYGDRIGIYNSDTEIIE